MDAFRTFNGKKIFRIFYLSVILLEYPMMSHHMVVSNILDISLEQPAQRWLVRVVRLGS